LVEAGRVAAPPTQRLILVEVRNGIYPWLNGPQSTRYFFPFTCWEADARMIAEPMSAGRLTWKGASSNTMRESAPSRPEGGNGFCSIPNVAKPAAKPRVASGTSSMTESFAPRCAQPFEPDEASREVSGGQT
jgi:hypothetical protein